MFGLFRKKDKTSIYDDSINRVLDSMMALSPEDKEWDSLVDHLERLIKLKAEGQRGKVDANTMAIVTGNLLGILVIVIYEQKHVLTSKATGFILRAK